LRTLNGANLYCEIGYCTVKKVSGFQCVATDGVFFGDFAQ
jgi:hypothetical protein